ncbi:hypothetical protein HXA34_20150 [Salipaludibacillus agaradhaerens]|uniref:hypothetical protein n=1 Tax=Salipaludibacillus agaradhaerens TaxID=76935 RepID=UPI002150B9EE|nr:hypothetical protein [Salipaludibacillus agaradhaerens]MCR6108604.1 hypothetical protein [Salipaludibacillus agaradhaerens]MCR6120633.1 hypothetical protein [Salipaludibacillus agaradhaerens]
MKTISDIPQNNNIQGSYDMEYVSFKGGRTHISNMEDRSLTTDDLKGVALTTYARMKIPPKMTDKALLQTAERYLSQCSDSGYPYVTYNDALVHTIVPELIHRLKEVSQHEVKAQR